MRCFCLRLYSWTTNELAAGVISCAELKTLIWGPSHDQEIYWFTFFKLQQFFFPLSIFIINSFDFYLIFDGEASVMLEFRGMQSTPTLSLLPGPLWPGVVAPNWVLSMGQIELNCVLVLNRIIWNRTVYTGPVAKWVECSPMVWKTGVQSQVESYQRLKKWYLMPLDLTLSIIR